LRGKANDNEEGSTTTGANDSVVSGGQADEGMRSVGTGADDDIGSDGAVGEPAATDREQGLDISRRNEKNSEPRFDGAKKKGVNCGKVEQFSALEQSSIHKFLHTHLLRLPRIQVRMK